MARTLYKAKLANLVELTPTVRELTIAFESPQEMPFRAGQFVMLHVPHDEKPVKRAYSIASTAQNPSQLRLIFKLVPGGIASEYVRSLHPEAPLELTGPFGKLFFREPPTEQILFLCTGAGISQHLCFLESLSDEHKNRKIRMLFGVWNEDEVFYQEKLENLKSSLPDFEYEYIIDKSIRDWNGKTGFVTDHIDQFNYHEVETTFYLCGNPSMIKGMKARLKEENFDSSRVFAEAFN